MVGAVEGHDRLVDAVVVDQVAQREAHVPVRKLLVLHVDGEVVHVAARRGADGDVRVLFQGRHVRHGEVHRDVDVAAVERQPLRLRLRHVPVDDARQLRRPAPVIVEAGEHDDVVGLPALQRERPRAGIVGGEPGARQVAVLLVLERELLVDHHGRRIMGERVHDEPRIGLLRDLEDHRGGRPAR